MIHWKRLSLLCTYLSLVLLSQRSCSTTICQPRVLGSSKWIVPGKTNHELDLYIHRGLAYSLTNAFTDIFLELNLTDEDTYDLYKAHKCSVVQEDFQYDNRLFGLLKSANFWRSRQLNVFNDTFVGISTRLPYTVHAETLKVNYIRFGVFVSSILLFIFAKKLARNSFFFYGSGCSLGFLTSLLIIVFIMYRIAPKSLVRLPFIIGGWSLSFYALHFIWRNSGTIFVKYQKLLLAYFVTVLAISFAVCYKRGPPKDSRSHDIAQWTLQAIALILIYSSSQMEELSLGIISILLLHSLTRSFFWNPLHRTTSVLANIWRKIFPPKPRLLTEEEYEKEGQEVTRRELERLREFCRSPEADVWKLTCRVRDPRRLARFVDGKEGHILEDEEDLYDEESGYSNQSNNINGYDDDDNDDEDNEKQKYAILDNDGNGWRQQVVFRRTLKGHGENVSIGKKSSRKSTGFFPSDRSHYVELPEHSHSAYYYQENSQPQNSHRLLSSFSVGSKSKRFPLSKAEHDSLFVRKYRDQKSTKVQRKRRIRPTSNEFFSSDSESDLEET